VRREFLTRTRGLRLAPAIALGLVAVPIPLDGEHVPEGRRPGEDVQRPEDGSRQRADGTTTFVTFTPARAGTYQLRARLRDTALKSSGFSAASTLRVS